MKLNKNIIVAALLLVFLLPFLVAAQQKNYIQRNPDCPRIEFVGRAADIFDLRKCEYISGITIKISYNGKLSYPSKLKFTLFDSRGNVMSEDRNKKVFGPTRLKKGQYGIFTIQNYGNENPPKISIQGIWIEDQEKKDKTLADLRTSLNLVRTTSKDRAFTAPTHDPSALIGLSRKQISSVLGAPNTCDSIMGAPCRSKGDWFYSFYKLPEGDIGGGPELLLQFGGDDVCTSARWVLTQ